MAKKKPMTMKDVNRIKRATSIANEGIIPKDSFAAKAESIFAKRNNKTEEK